jgi:hypothetical protein
MRLPRGQGRDALGDAGYPIRHVGGGCADWAAITATGISIDRIADGKIVGTWTNWDFWGLMEQLGVVSLPRPGA